MLEAVLYHVTFTRYTDDGHYCAFIIHNTIWCSVNICLITTRIAPFTLINHRGLLDVLAQYMLGARTLLAAASLSLYHECCNSF